jgi:uncharacterized membrane protein
LSNDFDKLQVSSPVLTTYAKSSENNLLLYTLVSYSKLSHNDFEIVNQISTSFLILINSFLYNKFGTTLLEVFNASSNNTQEFCNNTNALIKYIIFDCLTIYQKIGNLVKNAAKNIFHI